MTQENDSDNHDFQLTLTFPDTSHIEEDKLKAENPTFYDIKINGKKLLKETQKLKEILKKIS